MAMLVQGGGQLTVADYTQRFLERTLENVLADTEGRDEKQRLAESNFLSESRSSIGMHHSCLSFIACQCPRPLLQQAHNQNKIESFADLMHKLQEAGHKDDIRVPLRVLRGELACDSIDVPDLV